MYTLYVNISTALILTCLPLTEGQLLDRLSKKSTIEFKEDGQLYFVCADTIIRQGDTMPIELVSAEINELLVNSRKAEFIKAKKVELYNDAKLNGDSRIPSIRHRQGR